MSELTPRERQVLLLVSCGLTDRQIAERLHLATSTVSMHVMTARRKLGASSRAAAVAMFVRWEQMESVQLAHANRTP